jgi:hypothetical protein
MNRVSNIEVTEAKYHRNGVGGSGCYIVKFNAHGDTGERETLLAVCFLNEDSDTGLNKWTPEIAVIMPDNLNRAKRGADYYGDELVEFLNTEQARKMMWGR